MEIHERNPFSSFFNWHNEKQVWPSKSESALKYIVENNEIQQFHIYKLHRVTDSSFSLDRLKKESINLSNFKKSFQMKSC